MYISLMPGNEILDMQLCSIVKFWMITHFIFGGITFQFFKRSLQNLMIYWNGRSPIGIYQAMVYPYKCTNLLISDQHTQNRSLFFSLM